MVDALRRVVELFRTRQIAVVPVKGVVLSSQLYESPGQRPCGDVDVLVRPWQLCRALSAARRAGWPVFWDSKQLGNANFVVGGIPVDVAVSLGPPGTAAIGVADVVTRATPCRDPLGFDHLELEGHDHLLLLCIDAFKDKLGVKPWTREDLMRLPYAFPFRPEALVALAVRAQLTTLLTIVSDWLLQAPSEPWQRVRSLLPNQVQRPVYSRAYARWAQRARRGQRSAALSALTRAVSDSPTRAACAIALGAVGVAVYHAQHLLGAPRNFEESRRRRDK